MMRDPVPRHTKRQFERTRTRVCEAQYRRIDARRQIYCADFRALKSGGPSAAPDGDAGCRRCHAAPVAAGAARIGSRCDPRVAPTFGGAVPFADAVGEKLG